MEIKKLMLATDFSDASSRAAATARELASRLGAELDLVHVFDPSGMYMPAPYYFMAGVDHWIEDHLKACRDRGKASLAQLALELGGRVETHFIEGRPGHEVVEFARQRAVDMLILGTHGHTGLNRLVLGSIAEYVVRHAACMVLTVKGREEKG